MEIVEIIWIFIAPPRLLLRKMPKIMKIIFYPTFPHSIYLLLGFQLLDFEPTHPSGAPRRQISGLHLPSLV